MIPEVNDALSSGRKEVRVGGATLTGIIGHEWREGMLKLKAQWDHDNTTIEDLQDFKEDHPRMVATYITTHDCSRRKNGRRDLNLSWAKKPLRDCERAVRCITRLYDFYLNENDEVYTVRRSVLNKVKRKLY